MGSSATELLNYLVKNGTINLDDVKNEMEKSKIESVLREHPYKIYQGKDGRWITHVIDPDASEKRRKLAKKSKDDLYEELYRIYTSGDEKERLRNITLEELFPKWIAYKALHTRASTYITRIKSEWKRYYEGTAITKIPIRDLTKLMLDEWIHRIVQENDLTRNQYYNCSIIMRQALDYAVDLNIIEINYFDRIKVDGRRMFRKTKKKPSETQVFTRDEVEKIRKLVWEDFYSRTKLNQNAPLAVLFQFLTGLRIGELCALKFSDVDGYYLHVQRMLRRDTKEIVEHTKGNSEDRVVILTEEARRIIECAKERQLELGRESEFIFSTTGEVISYYAITDLYRKYCRKMGIVHKSSHKSRKTYISSMIDANVNINTIREMVGHSDERTTYNNYCYDRRSDDEKLIQIEAALA